jgi:hypothetical protein
LLMTLAQIGAAIMREIDKPPRNPDLNYPILLPGVRCVNPGRENLGKWLVRGDFRVPWGRDESSDCRGRGHAHYTLGTSPGDSIMMSHTGLTRQVPQSTDVTTENLSNGQDDVRISGIITPSSEYDCRPAHTGRQVMASKTGK